MRKRMFALFAAALLCGCEAQSAPGGTDATGGTLPVVTEPAGSYLPGSAAEISTEGAVRVYEVGEDCYAIDQDGGDILLFSGTASTTLTRLTGENLYATAQMRLDLFISPEDVSFQVTDNGVTYFDGETGEVVFLDNDLKEVSRIQTPADMTGSPVLSSSRSKLYYCTASALRVLDLETGLDAPLNEMAYARQSLQGILLGDSVVYCTVSDGESDMALFLSAENGAKLGTAADLTITSYGDVYYAKVPEGSMEAKIFGQSGGEPQALNILEDAWYLEEIGCALGVVQTGDGVEISCYDLTSGLRTGVLSLDIQTLMAAEGQGNYVYLLGEDADGGRSLYRWEVAQTPSGDESLYTSIRYTQDNPDTQGLAECAQAAKRLGDACGLEILVGMEAAEIQPRDYALSPEYQPLVIMRELEKLEALLQNFPAGFFDALAETAGGQPVKLCLVRSVTGSPESGSLEDAAGAQFWQADAAYVALAAGDGLEGAFYHGLFHVIDTRVFSECTAYYDWDSLNPEGFSYSYGNTAGEGDEYLEEETRAFIDADSMCYPREDRASVMEYAATAGNESYFISSTMQAKLRTLCQGIREAFDLQEYPEALLWEQYLFDPLTP